MPTGEVVTVRRCRGRSARGPGRHVRRRRSTSSTARRSPTAPATIDVGAVVAVRGRARSSWSVGSRGPDPGLSPGAGQPGFGSFLRCSTNAVCSWISASRSGPAVLAEAVARRRRARRPWRRWPAGPRRSRGRSWRQVDARPARRTRAMWLVTTWAAGAASTWRWTSAISAIIASGWARSSGLEVVEARAADPPGHACRSTGAGSDCGLRSTGTSPPGVQRLICARFFPRAPGSSGDGSVRRWSRNRLGCRCSGRRLVLYGAHNRRKAGLRPHPATKVFRCARVDCAGSITDRSVRWVRASASPASAFVRILATRRSPPSPSATGEEQRIDQE